VSYDEEEFDVQSREEFAEQTKREQAHGTADGAGYKKGRRPNCLFYISLWRRKFNNSECVRRLRRLFARAQTSSSFACGAGN
jgi:hypothetical protein